MNELITEDEINIENMIYEIRGKQVMFDNALAKLYQIETGALNRQMKRNNNRFPSDFCFQLSKDEYKNLKCQIGISKSNNTYGGRRTLPYVYTEYGVSMLSSVLHTIVYHCGTSINYAGSKTFSINKIEDVFVKDSLINNISKVIE